MALGRTDPRVSDPSVDYHHNRKSIDHQSSSSTTQSRNRKFIVYGNHFGGDSDIVPGDSDSSYSPTSNGENSYSSPSPRPRYRRRSRRGHGGAHHCVSCALRGGRSNSGNSNGGSNSYRRHPIHRGNGYRANGGGSGVSSSSPSYITSSGNIGNSNSGNSYSRPPHRRIYRNNNSPSGSSNSPSYNTGNVHRVPIKKYVMRSRPPTIYKVIQGSNSPPPNPHKIYRIVQGSNSPPPQKIYRVVQSSAPVRHVLYLNSNSGNGGHKIGYVVKRQAPESALISLNL